MPLLPGRQSGLLGSGATNGRSPRLVAGRWLPDRLQRANLRKLNPKLALFLPISPCSPPKAGKYTSCQRFCHRCLFTRCAVGDHQAFMQDDYVLEIGKTPHQVCRYWPMRNESQGNCCSTSISRRDQDNSTISLATKGSYHRLGISDLTANSFSLCGCF